MLLIYVVGTFALGLFFASKVHSSQDLFTAGRKSPWWVSGLSGFMTMFSAATFVVWGGIAYRHGIVAIVINLMYGFAALLVGYFLAGKWRRLGVNTAAEFIELRFGKVALLFYTFANLIFRMVGVGGSLYAIAILVCALIPLDPGHFLRDPATEHLSVYWAIAIIGLLVTVYTMVGGLWAVLMTDVLQFVVLTVSVAFVVPLILQRAGGINAFISAAPKDFFLPTAGGWTWYILAGWCAIHFFMIGAEWAFVQRFLCVPSERDAKKSAYLFGALYLISPILWMLPPMVYRTINPNVTHDDQAYVMACQAVLPTGMLGLMIAAMFSATASIVDSQLNVFSGVLTNDIYKKWIRPDASDKHLTNVGRLVVLFLGLALVCIAISIPLFGGKDGAKNIVLTIAGAVIGPLMLPTVWGLLSKKIGTKAVLTVTILSLAIVSCFKLWLIYPDGMFFQSLKPLHLWVTQNQRAVEMCLGMVLPLVLLSVCEVLAQGVAPGWQRVNQRSKSEAESPDIPTSNMPGKVVAWSLIACGTLDLAIIPFVEKGTSILVLFASVLLVVGTGILYWIRPTKQA